MPSGAEFRQVMSLSGKKRATVAVDTAFRCGEQLEGSTLVAVVKAEIKHVTECWAMGSSARAGDGCDLTRDSDFAKPFLLSILPFATISTDIRLELTLVWPYPGRRCIFLNYYCSVPISQSTNNLERRNAILHLTAQRRFLGLPASHSKCFSTTVVSNLKYSDSLACLAEWHS